MPLTIPFTYDTYPTARDLSDFVAGTTLAGDADTYAAAIQASIDEWERRTSFHPFLASAPQSRYFDPPSRHTLDLPTGILQMGDTDLSIGVVWNFQGTPLTRNLHYYLEPANADQEGRPWTAVRFLARIHGIPQSVKITAVWGRVSKLPAMVWQAILHRAAATLSTAIGLSISQGANQVKDADFQQIFSGPGEPTPLAGEKAQWDCEFDRAVMLWKRISV